MFSTDRHGDWQYWADTCGDAGADDEESCKEVNERCEWGTIAQYEEVDEGVLDRVKKAMQDCKEFYTADPLRLSTLWSLCRSAETCGQRLENQLNACRGSSSYKNS